MSLTSRIQALIDYANETTEAGDVLLGDAVKTLADGYQGGGSSPSSFPAFVGEESFPAKLSALLAYANSVTGAGDVRLGDAIRTLCEGYGGDEPVPSGVVFYNRLIGDGRAYIRTDFIPMPGDDVTLEWKSKVVLTSLPCPISSGTGTYIFIITGSFFKYFTSGEASSMVYIVDNFYRMHFLPDGTLERENLDTGTTGSVTSEVSKTKQPSGGELFLFRRANLATGAALEIRSLLIKRNDAVVLDLRPCTYEGTPGMWDMVSNTFLGNAGTTGSFTVAND